MFGAPFVLVFALALPPVAARQQAIAVNNDAVQLFARNDTEAAEKALRQATTLDPSFAHAWLNLGHLYGRQDRLAEAEAAFASGLKAGDPALTAELHDRLGTVLWQRAQAPGQAHADRVAGARKALEHLQAALKADPWRSRAFYTAGRCHEFLDQPTEADRAFRRAIELDPEFSPAYSALGQMYVDYGFVDVGLVVLEVDVKINPTDLDAWKGLGHAQMKAGKPGEAVASFGKALELDPGAVDVLYGLGMAHAELRDRTRAVEHLQQFLRHAGTDVPEHYKKAANDTIARMHDVP